jgi:hypothetical protein
MQSSSKVCAIKIHLSEYFTLTVMKKVKCLLSFLSALFLASFSSIYLCLAIVNMGMELRALTQNGFREHLFSVGLHIVKVATLEDF